MQKYILIFLAGAIVASSLWAIAYFRADSDSAGLIAQVRSESDSAIARAESAESELGGALSRVRELEETNGRIEDILKKVTVSSAGISKRLGEYGYINNDLRDFIETHGVYE